MPTFCLDTFFEIGHSHDICEDYARFSDEMVVVSDGCSNGGGPSIDSDWGSRLLTMAAMQHEWLLSVDRPRFLQAVWETACVQENALCSDLDPECLTATLLAAKVLEETESIGVLVVGDGVFGGRRKDGSWSITNIEYGTTMRDNKPQNAPCYLKYVMRPGALDRYIEKCSGWHTRTIYEGQLMDPNAEMQETTDVHQISRDEWFIAKEFPFSEFDFVFVGSDGLSSFQKRVHTDTQKYTTSVPLVNVLRVLFDALDTRPGYLRHQRKWNWRRNATGSFTQRDWRNDDDVAVGGIHILP